MIFQITWLDYDCSQDYYFEGEGTVEEFDALVRRLMSEVAADLSGWEHGYIGYSDLLEDVALRLPDHGFARRSFPTVKFRHGFILGRKEDDEEGVLTEEALQAVITHNNNVTMRAP
jgi:hypothetical protein